MIRTGWPRSSRRSVRVRACSGVLRGGVAAAAGIGLDAGDRAEVDDQAVAGGDELRQQGARHAQHAEDVELEHGAPLVVDRGGETLGAEGVAGVVHQHVDPVERGAERRDARLVGDVERHGSAPPAAPRSPPAAPPAAPRARPKTPRPPAPAPSPPRSPELAPVTTATRPECTLFIGMEVYPMAGEAKVNCLARFLQAKALPTGRGRRGSRWRRGVCGRCRSSGRGR